MDEILRLINKNVVRIVTKKIVSELTKRFVFLSWGPFGWILSSVVERIVEKAYKYGHLLVTDAIVDRVISNDVEKLDLLTDKLAEYENNNETYSQKELDTLDEELINSYRDLFRF